MDCFGTLEDFQYPLMPIDSSVSCQFRNACLFKFAMVLLQKKTQNFVNFLNIVYYFLLFCFLLLFISVFVVKNKCYINLSLLSLIVVVVAVVVVVKYANYCTHSKNENRGHNMIDWLTIRNYSYFDWSYGKMKDRLTAPKTSWNAYWINNNDNNNILYKNMNCI